MPKGNRLKNDGTNPIFYKTIETIYDAKVIEPTNLGSYSLPRMSHSPNALYIVKSKKDNYASLGIYNQYRELTKEFDISHDHKFYEKGSKKISKRLIEGVAHVHNDRGGRNSNVRYMTKKEIRKYGKYIIAMGGLTNE